MAAKYRHRDVLDLLMRNGANVSQVDDNGNVLYFAYRYGQLDIVKCILSESGVDINRRGKEGKTHLMVATIYRRGDALLELLMRNGANVSQVDDYGNNALHYACQNGQLDVVKYLLSQGSVNRGKDGDCIQRTKTHFGLPREYGRQ
ncbi:putative ankyrin repeat protein RF_0381 [Haliotis asinina]|uniref:putative ankyrin repeat protein RF_0381 n=1 Tax=Haliotis asinina TaxID=109174 RepID=UPI0035327347